MILLEVPTVIANVKTLAGQRAYYLIPSEVGMALGTIIAAFGLADHFILKAPLAGALVAGGVLSTIANAIDRYLPRGKTDLALLRALPGHRVATAASAMESHRRMAAVRAALADWPDRNLWGVIVFGGTAKLTAGPQNDFDYLFVLKQAASPLISSEWQFIHWLHSQHGFFERPSTMPLIVDAAADRLPYESFDFAVRSIFLPAELFGAVVFNAREPGRALITQYEILARTAEDERAISDLLEQRIQVILSELQPPTASMSSHPREIRQAA